MRTTMNEFTNLRQQMRGILTALAVGVPAGFLFCLAAHTDTMDARSDDRRGEPESHGRDHAFAALCTPSQAK